MIGSHSHIVGDTEEYKGKQIFYSLGNFVFDQYFSKETMNGLGVILNIKKTDDKVSSSTIEFNISQIPFAIDKEGVRIATTTNDQ